MVCDGVVRCWRGRGELGGSVFVLCWRRLLVVVVDGTYSYGCSWFDRVDISCVYVGMCWLALSGVVLDVLCGSEGAS